MKKNFDLKKKSGNIASLGPHNQQELSRSSPLSGCEIFSLPQSSPFLNVLYSVYFSHLTF